MSEKTPNWRDSPAFRDISDEEIAKARKRTEEYINEYALKQARKSRRLTQVAVALKMGVSQKRISKLESGDVSRLKMDTLKRYAETLGGKLRVEIELPGKTIHLMGE
ncbi:MAG: helix-turn-helix domain-containing protein [Bifidobacteriaceae bacterium]|jgi:predicted XRE-type DNA-binding protein|nr:helix-turn-helix domain-containing protein [Bifidobacteriaceae bacterium]